MARTLEDLRKERETRKTQTRSLDALAFEKNSSAIIADIKTKLKEYDDEVRKYGDIYNSTFFDESGKAKLGYISDIKEKGKAASAQTVNIVKKRRAVEDIVNKWSQYLDKDYQANLKKYLDTSNADLTKLSKDFQSTYDAFGSFENESDYNSYLDYKKGVEEKNAQEKEYLANYDAEASKKELDKLASLYDHYTKTTKKSDWGKTNRELMQYGFTSVEKLERAYKAKEEEYGLYTALAEKHETKKPSALQVTFGDKEADKGLENAQTKYVPGTSASVVQGMQREKGKENISRLQFAENLQDTEQRMPSAGEYNKTPYEEKNGVNYNYLDYHYYESNPKAKFVTFATDEEYNLYSELLQKGDTAAAEAYAESLDEELNTRMRYYLNETIYQEPGQKYSLAFGAGVEGAFENAGTYFDSVVNTIKGNELEANIPIEQQVFSDVAASSKGLQKVALEAINTTSAMLPAVGLGLIPGVGSALSQGMLFSQAAGGAVAEAKAKGYTDDQAMQYGTMVGATELLMEKFLGGLPGVSKLSKAAEKTLSQLDNVFLRVVGKAGVSGFSEFFEEGIQAYLEPYIATIVSGEDYDPPTLLEAVYQGLLGFLSGVGLSTVTAVPTEVARTTNVRNAGRDIKNTPELYEGLVELGANIPEARKAAERAQKKNSDYNVGMLYGAIEESVRAESKKGTSGLAEFKNRVLNAVAPSSTVSARASEIINNEITRELDKTDMTEEAKQAVASGFNLPSDIDAESDAATEYVKEYVFDVLTAYEAGKISKETGVELSENLAKEYAPTLTTEQADTVVKLGQIAALEKQQKVDEKKSALRRRLAPSNEELIKSTKADTTLSAEQKRAAEVGEKLGLAVVYDDTTKYYPSKRDGVYIKGKKVIMLDKSTTDPMKQVFTHEITHFSESSKYYTKLSEKIFRSKALDKWLSDKGYTEKTLVGKISAYRNAKKSAYAQAGETLTKEGADAELIAVFLADTVGTEERFDSFMSELTSEEKKTFLDWLKETITRIYDAFSGSIPSELREIERLYKKAVKDAGETNKAKLSPKEELKLHQNGVGVDLENGVVFSIPYSYATISDVKQREAAVENLAKDIQKVTGRSIEDVRKWLHNETTLAAEIMQDPDMMAVATYEADDRYQAIKQNSDYPQGTVDLSNLCPKRSVFTWMISRLQEKYPDRLFDAVQLAEMRGILEKADIQVACALCFVEDRRQKVGEIADIYKNMWKDAVESGRPLTKTNANGERKPMKITKRVAGIYGVESGKYLYATDTYIPNQYDLTTYEGFKKLQVVHPQVAMGFEMYNNSRGQQAARLIEGRAEYKRQILDWSDKKVKQVNDAGGLRIFSFSDFEVAHLVDIIQIIIDCSAKGVKIQGYTKIPAFAKLVRNTGIKLNRSLIPKGNGIKIVNGKKVLDYDLVEGMDMNDKNFLDEEDSADVGNVLVGINAEQIALAMVDPFIDYIIPFHTNKSKAVCQALGLESWKNYKESQHDKNNRTGKAAKKNINIYTEVLDVYHPKNKVEFVEAFLEVAKKKNYTPRFAEFLNTDASGNYVYTEGYHKFLVDFKLFDKQGNILPQGLVTPDLDANFMRELIASEVEKNKDFSQYEDVFAELDSEYGEQFAIPEEKSVDMNDLSSEAGERVNKNSRKFDEAFINDTLRNFGITKPKDYIHVQRQVLSTLVEEGFFANKETRSRVDINEASGMVIETNKSSIDETFSKATYKNVGMDKKIAKLATIRLIPEIIRKGVVVKDNVPNQYGNSDNKTFAYIEGNVIVDGKKVYLKLDVKKTRQKNKFYVHNIVNIENITSLPAGTDEVQSQAQLTDDVSNTIPQSDKNVKEQYSIPDNSLAPRVEQEGESIPERTRRLEQRFADGEIEYDELVRAEAELMGEARDKYGVIEEGENAEVKANVPAAVEDNKVNSKYVRTILETGAVSDALARQLGAKTLLGDFSHTPISDKNAISEADEAIKQHTAENKWGKTVENIYSVPSKYDLAIGEQLLANALKEGKTTKAIEIASDLVDVYTRAGQALQSARLLKKLTGVGRLVQMQRTVNQINEDIQKRSKKHPAIKISESLAEEMANAKTPEDVEAIAKDIETDVASQMKVTLLDIANAWRYLCMLANPITHIRNLVGNMIFVPSVQTRRALQYVMEKALPAEQRTVSYKIDDKYREFAEKMVNDPTVRSVLDGTDKYSAKTKAMMQRKVLPKPLQAIYEKNSELLGGEDMWYKTRYYKNALASYLQARQIDLDKITETEIAKASQYAITEAMKNTYADESALARWLNSAKSLGFGGYLAVESLLPFRKTPINIIKRGIEYSPFGLVSTLTMGTAKLKNGKITASEYIYGLSAGGTGTIAFVMGMFLAAIGAASGGFGDDDESKYRKLLGEQEYALIIDGKSYTIDWAAPINIPFFMGVELMKQLESQNGEVRFADAVAKSTFAMLDPIIKLSMLSGLQRAFQSLRYGEDAASFGAVAGSAVASYASQFVPAVGGKVTSFVSEDRKANYIDKNSQLPSFVQSILNSMMAKSIFFDNRNPYIDAWGRTVSQGNWGERFLENFVSPGYFNKTDYTIVDVALMELYEETGEMGILPDAAGKYFAVDGVRKDLTADEYTRYAQAKGQYSFVLIKEFFDSDISKDLTAEEKVKTIKKMYEYATDKAKAVVSDYNVEKNNKTAYGEEKAGRSVAQYFAENVEAERYAPKLFNQALEDGNTEDIKRLKQDILNYKKERGDTSKEALQSLRQSVTTYWKPKYLEAWIAQDSAEMKRITEALEASGLYDSVRYTKEEWYREYLKEQRKSK